MGVEVVHLHKHIGKQHVLDDVNLAIEEGEVVGLLGPNGAGKSTLMKILVGVWEQDKNSGVLGSKWGVRHERNGGREDGGSVVVPDSIGYLPEQNPLYEDMYVREYLRFFVGLRHACPKKETGEYVEALINRVGLCAEANKRIGALSKGYKQRVGLAQALIGDPKLLILDEPTTGLDPNQLEDIRALIREMGRDRMVILSTHILQEVVEMCSRVVIIDKGQIRADKQMSEIGGVSGLEELFRSVTN